MRCFLMFLVVLFASPAFPQQELYLKRTENSITKTYPVLDIAKIRAHNGEPAITIVIEESHSTDYCKGNLDCFVSADDVLTVSSTEISASTKTTILWTRIGKKPATLSFSLVRQSINGKTIHYLRSDFFNGYVFYLLRVRDESCGGSNTDCARFVLEAHYASPLGNHPFVTPDDPKNAEWLDTYTGSMTQPSSGSGTQPPPRP